ncbi:transglycosylase domain-containing protein [Salinibacillus aidingensis]|uniref:Transglycosylase domain-containing protein n=1 Tax=Salinibacillus aidingensis TaxID=237684 RepID=A0ABN1B7L2_9BACI
MLKRTRIKELWNQQHPAVKWALILGSGTILLSIIGFSLILLGGKWVVDDKGFVFSEATVIQTESGEEVATLYSENRTYVPIDQIPDYVQNAFIAIEDQRFYKHAGVDLISVGRAVFRDLIAFEKVEGASTITQQLVKNLFLTNDKSWMRKTKEVMGAIYLERNMSKNKILEYYLNEIYFGHGVYGIQEASRFYFNKNVQDLTVSEGAMLAAIPKSPTYFSPVDYPDNAKERRNLVLASMQEMDMLDVEEMTSLQGKTLGIEQGNPDKRPWIETYVDLVLKEMEKKFHISRSQVYRGGYTIVTGIDPDIQRIAYERFQMDEYFKGGSTKGMEGAFVLIDQETGAITAALGGTQFERGDLNRVSVKRQPGSVIKPLSVYGPALETGNYTPYSLLVDEKRTYQENYTPENYNDTYEGKVTMYEALVQSKNAPAVWLLNEIGIPYVKGYFDGLNISLPDQQLAIALGGLSRGISPLEMAKAYRTFVHQGQSVEPYAIIQVKKDGEVVGKVEMKENQIFEPQTAWNMTKMLQAVVNDGTGSYGQFSKALAGKTGTTQHPSVSGMNKDIWFAGYTPEYVGAVWMGYDRTDKEHYVKSGSSAPTKLMKDILTDIDQKRSLAKEFNRPDNVRELSDPVRLPVVDDLQVDRRFGIFSGVTAELTWTPSEDERVIYRIYEKSANGSTLIGEVEGKGTFEDENIRMLEKKTYYIVPYNPLSKESGQPSNEAVID